MDLYFLLLYVMSFFHDKWEEEIEISSLDSAKYMLDEIEQREISIINSKFAIYKLPGMPFNNIVSELKTVETCIRNNKDIPYLKCLHVEETSWYWNDFFTNTLKPYRPETVKLVLLTRARTMISLVELAKQNQSMYFEYYYARVEKLVAVCIDILEELHYEQI